MFRLTKYLFIVGVPVIIVSVLVLSWMYRWVAFSDIKKQSEASNLILTRTMANALWPQIGNLVISTTQGDKKDFFGANDEANPASLQIIHVLLVEPINELIAGTNVVRVKLFNMDGLTLFSSAAEQAGTVKPSAYAPIANARQGLVTTRLEQYDEFISHAGERLANRTVLTSYLPVRSSETGGIEAVFEIYSDVTNVFDDINTSQLKFATVLAAIFALIYAIVFFILRHLDQAIHRNIELVVARDSAKDANKAKSQFLANMSHELRTPLNAVIGYSEMLEEDVAFHDEKTALQDLRKIQSAAHHLLSLINEILDLSKIEAGQMELFYEDINIPGLVSEIVAVVTPLFNERGNRFKLDLDPSINMVNTDVMKLRQVLLNLLSNASKFTEGGTVALKIRRAKESLIFSVGDTGIGLSEEQIAQLFKPFMQADASTTRKYGGTGLGLAISKQFCELLGGQITVSSVPGSGSVFNVKIPFIPAQEQLESQDDKQSAA